MSRLKIERVGGLAGIGGPGARIKSEGELQINTLSDADRLLIETLFNTPRTKAAPSPMRDGFSYRLSRTTQAGVEIIEVSGESLPAVVTASVKDELI